MLRCLFSILLLVVSTSGQAQTLSTVIDLQSAWTVWNGTDYVPYAARQRVDAVHFMAPQSRGRYDTLVVVCPGPCSIYVNHRLVERAITTAHLSLDSLLGQFSTPALISIYQRGGVDRLQTKLITPALKQSDEATLALRPEMPLYDFSILATIALFVFFVALLYSNLHHTIDYINVLKLFTLQEREDNVLNSRVSASANIVFYFFTSLMIGLVLLVIFNHAKGELGLSKWFLVGHFGEAVLAWLVLSILVFALLLVKYVLIAIMCSLFNWREHLPIHFFNFVRLLFFAFAITAGCCLVLFIAHEQNGQTYAKLLWIIAGALMVWGLLIALKLTTRVGPRFFHLFSYLCASEFIPVIITIKFLLS